MHGRGVSWMGVSWRGVAWAVWLLAVWVPAGCGGDGEAMPAAELDADTDAGTDAGATLECPRPVGLYRILATELEGDCGDFEGVARLGEDSGLCAKDTEYRDAGCTIDLDTFCEEEESDGSLTTRRTRGTLRRSAGSLDYTGMIEFAIQSSVEAPCSGSFELRWEWIGGGDAG